MSVSPSSAFGLRSPRRGAEGGEVNSPLTPDSSLLDHPRTSVNLHAAHSFITVYCSCCNHTISVPEYCGNRFCPLCGARRRARVKARLQQLVTAAVPSKSERLKMVTLTLPKCQDAREGVKVLTTSFRKLRARPLWRNSVSGGAFVIEICGRPGAWHVHLHVLINALFIPVRRLARLWATVSPGKIVDIRLASRDKSVSYLTKYLSKASVPENLQHVVSDALKGSRLFQPFGLWYHLLPPIKRKKYQCPECGETAWMSQYEVDRICRQATGHALSADERAAIWPGDANP